MSYKKRAHAPIFAIACILCFLATICCGFQPAFATESDSSSAKPENETYFATVSESFSAKTESKSYFAKADLFGNVDEYLQKCVENAHIPAMSVSIVNKDELLFSANYGQCTSSDTPFWLGSVSKSFTAVCVMQLAEQGKIDLNSPISEYLTKSHTHNTITVAQLLNHTSGLGEHQTLKNYKIVNEQGVHNYANVNYSLLGEIIEKVGGKSYDEYISENVFEPLGLSHTAATLDESVANGVIDGYTNYWGVQTKSAPKYPSSQNDWITVPAGYISSSANDLGKYLQMYLNGGMGIISQESIDKMFYGDTVFVDGDIPFWYGYGWAMVKDPLPQKVLHHSGLVETGTSCVFILPESGVAVALEANVNDYFVTNEMMDSLGWGVVLMLLGLAPNEIASNAYVLNHLWIDLIMFAVLLSAILPLCLFPRYAKRAAHQKFGWKTSMVTLLLHLVLPILILLIAPVGFGTPLWVAEAFVPDVFVTVIVASTLLFAVGLAKGILLARQAKNKTD